MVPAIDAINIILDEASEALAAGDAATVLRLTGAVEALDPGNRVARALRMAAEAAGAGGGASPVPSGTHRAGTLTLARHRHEHSIDAVVSSLSELSPFSAVAFRLIELLDDDLSSTDEVARVAGTDPALTARIIKAANSAYYRRRVRVATIRDAVLVLGAREVRSLVITTCVVDSMPRTKFIDHHAFWQFSLATAILADLIARADGDLSGEAFTAGVLHNVGLLALDHYCPEGLREVTEIVAAGRRRLHDREQLVFGFTDAELSARLAQQWSLPPGIVKAIANQGVRLDEVDDRNRVTSALVRARIFAKAQGMSDGLEVGAVRDPGAGFLPARAQARLNQLGRWEDLLEMIDALLTVRPRD